MATATLNVRLVGMRALMLRLWCLRALAAVAPRLTGRLWHVRMASDWCGGELVMRPRVGRGPGLGRDNVILIDFGALAVRAWRMRTRS